MTRRTRIAIVALFAAGALLGACGDDDDSVVAGDDTTEQPGDTTAADGSDPTDGAAGGIQLGPDAIGTIELVDGGGARIVDVNDPYYEGMGLTGEAMEVVDGDGQPAELVAGARGEVFLAPDTGCRESYPVQCDVMKVIVRP